MFFQVVGLHQYPVRPDFIGKTPSTNGSVRQLSNGTNGHANDSNAADADENDNECGGGNRLSDQVRAKYPHLSEDVLRSAPPLGAVINQFDREVASKLPSFRLVSDGQLHVRQCLFPEGKSHA